MVHNAIKNLKERNGSSLQGIKKYISANYKTDAKGLSPFIKKYLESAISDGELVQVKRVGSSDLFKLADRAKSETPEEVAAPKKYVKEESEMTAKDEIPQTAGGHHQNNNADKIQKDSISEITQISLSKNSRLVRQIESLFEQLTEKVEIQENKQSSQLSEIGRLRKDQEDLMELLTEQVIFVRENG